MIRTLRFGPANCSVRGQMVREKTFEPSCAIPVKAVCHLANGVRETLGRLLGRTLHVEVIEPVAPPARAVPLMFGGAYVFAINGPLCDLWLVFRAIDARSIVSGVFRDAEEIGALSPMELKVLTRLARELVPMCAPLCGSAAAECGPSEFNAARRPDAYLELVCSGPFTATLGIALFGELRDPPEATIARDTLLDVPVRARAELARGKMSLSTMAALECGSVVPMDTKVGSPAALKVGEATVAWGQCGFLDGRAAFQFSQAAGCSEQ